MTDVDPKQAPSDPSAAKSLWFAWLGGPVTFVVASHTYELWDDGWVGEPILAVTWVATLIGHVASGPRVTALVRGQGLHEPRRLCLGMHWIALGVLALVTAMGVPILHLAIRDIIAWNAVAFVAVSAVNPLTRAVREISQRY